MRYRQIPVTLGMQSRAIRLSFFILGKYYLRLSRHSDELFRVELHPLTMINGRAMASGDLYIVWCDQEDRQGLVDSIKPLRGVVRVKKYISFLIDEMGELAL